MKFGDIKIAALKLMHINTDGDINLETLKNGEYAREVFGMPESINRAIDRILAEDILGNKTARTKAYNLISKDNSMRIRLEAVASDIETLNSITYVDEQGNRMQFFPYTLEGDKVVVIANQKVRKGEYILEYARKIFPLTQNTPDTTSIDLPDELARLIPYFIKAELYEEDEPSAAANAMKMFEDGLDRAKRKSTAPNVVQDVWGVRVW